MAQRIDINQVIAYNLMRIRKALGLSQEQATERLEPHIGVRWSKAVYSAAERSYAGKRVRQFTAADVAAFAGAFQVPLMYFFLPPKPEDREADGVMIGGRLVAWPNLLNMMLDGKQQSALHLRLVELPAEEWVDALNQLAGLGRWADSGSAVDQLSVVKRGGERMPASDQQPVVAVIVRSGLGVLVGKRNDGKPPWTFIAGEVEPGELPEDAAVREVKEEAGLEVRAGQVIGERDHPETGRHMIYMSASPTRGTDVFVGDEAELAEVRWVGLAEADELLPGMFEPVREHLARDLGEAGER